MTIEVKAAGVTVRAVEPEMLPRLAMMLAAPTANVLASPCVPKLLLMVATAVALELQVAMVVRSSVLPSL